MILNSISEATHRIGRLILLATTAVLSLFLLLALLRIGLIYWLYSTVEEWVTVRLGLDYYGAQLATTVVVSIFTALLPTLAWYVLLGRKRLWGTAAMIGGQALICLLVYTVGGQVCFDRRTGAPLCYYADTPAGRVWSYTPGYDPKTGRPFRLYTREVQEREKAERRGQEEESRRRQAEEQGKLDAAQRQQQAEQRRLEQSERRWEEREQKKQELLEQRNQLAEQQRAVQAQRQLEREQRAREEEERRQEELERQRREDETRRLLTAEQQRREEAARIAEERELRRQAEQERRECEAAQREREAEQRRRDAEESRRREEGQRRRDARNRLIIELINRGVERIPRRNF